MTEEKTCIWCKDEERPVAHTGLCRRCYRLKRELKKAESNFQQTEGAGGLARDDAERKLEYAKRMVELAQREGDWYGEIDSKPIDGHWLELEFRRFSERVIGKEMFFGHATIFDHEFTLEQCRRVFSYLAKMTREFLRRNRRLIAHGTKHLESGWEEFV